MAVDSCDLLCLDLQHAEEVRAALPCPDTARGAAERARALADPTRLRVATALAVGGELCVCDLAWVCGSAQNLISHHARQLRAVGLAASRREGRLVMYRLTPLGRDLLVAVTGNAGLPSPTGVSTPASTTTGEAASTVDPAPLSEVH